MNYQYEEALDRAKDIEQELEQSRQGMEDAREDLQDFVDSPYPEWMEKDIGYWQHQLVMARNDFEYAMRKINELSEKQAKEKAEFWLRETKGRNPF